MYFSGDLISYGASLNILAKLKKKLKDAKNNSCSSYPFYLDVIISSSSNKYI